MNENYVFLGRGGYGTVRLSKRYHPPRAEKLIPRTVDGFCMKKAVKKECQALERLHHPNIVVYYGMVIAAEDFIIQMEYCDRGPLSAVLRNPKISYNLKTVLIWCEHLFSALVYLNTSLVFHRDIKPANIFVSNQSHLKLGDFGTVRYFDVDNSVTLTGTHRYMSPEMYSSREISHQSDIYSTGLVIWEIVERKIVFDEFTMNGGFNPVRFHQEILAKKRIPLREMRSFPALNAFVQQCTDLTPEKRSDSRTALNTIKAFQESMKKTWEAYDFEPHTSTVSQLRRPAGICGNFEREGQPIDAQDDILPPNISTFGQVSIAMDTDQQPNVSDSQPLIPQEGASQLKRYVKTTLVFSVCLAIMFVVALLLWLALHHSPVKQNCQYGWNYFNGSCYKMYSQKVGYSVAEAECRDNNANVTSIHSAQEQAFVNDLREGSWTWIGLQHDSKWTWSDGSDVDYTNWEDGHPILTRGLTNMRRDTGKWESHTSLDSNHFICKKPSIK